MDFEYTRHARERLEFRHIKEEWIRSAILNPDTLLDAKRGRKQAVKKVNGDKISAVYKIENDRYIIITVFWGI